MTLLLNEIGVSRETIERLEVLQRLTEKWTRKINLVSRNTIDDIWTRHIEDSAQIWTRAPKNAEVWVDLGSGGGFPGLVVAIFAHQLNPEMRVTLVESDQRKSVFLRTALRETGVQANVISDRIERVDPLKADVLSARALSELTTLLAFAERHMNKDGTALFPKGRTWKKEVDAAQDSWSFELQCFKSLIDENSVILKVQEISHA